MQIDQTINDLSYKVIGAAIEVHRELGPGLMPHVYKNSLAIEMGMQKIPFVRQLMADVHYKGECVGEGCVDFLVEDRLVVAVRAMDTLTPLETAKVLAQLKVAKRPLGLLMNFNTLVMKDGIRRIIASQYGVQSSD